MSEKIAANNISILITGKEVLDGRVAETNSHFFIQSLHSLNLEAKHVLSCRDDIRDIKRSLEFLGKSSSIIIVSGGLGPTSDDLTREAISEYAKLKLILNGDVLGRLEDFFRKKKRPFDQSNCKQALFPETASTIDNPTGSALGFQLQVKFGKKTGPLIIALPGVPREIHSMIDSVTNIIKSKIETRETYSRTFKIFGLPESVIGTRVKNAELPDDIYVSYRASFPEVEVIFSGDTDASCKQAAEKAKPIIGEEFIYSQDSSASLATTVHKLLVDSKSTISTAESCTAGLLSMLLTDPPGSSAYFIGGILSYNNSVKVKELSVTQEILTKYGAVSHETAKAMANAARTRFNTTYTLSITGIAGPDGGTEDKPVGTFFIALASADQVTSYRFYVNTSRKLTRLFAAWTALDTLRRHILNLPIHEQKL